MKPERDWPVDKVERKEGKIAPSAGPATQAAFVRALAAGSVDFVRDGKLVRLTPSGKATVLGQVAPKVRKEKTVYRLVWTPPSLD